LDVNAHDVKRQENKDHVPGYVELLHPYLWIKRGPVMDEDNRQGMATPCGNVDVHRKSGKVEAHHPEDPIELGSVTLPYD
jgi:hypothetical protein